MLLPKIFERFMNGRPITALLWGILEHALPATEIEQLFTDAAEQQYMRELLFSSVVGLMSDVVCRWAGRLGIRDPAAVTVLGDGAEWIWQQAEVQLPGAARLLDIYHGLEHLSRCTQVVYGEGTTQALAWTEAGRQALLMGGGAAVQAHIAATRCGVRSAAARQALAEVSRYFARRGTYLGDAERLALGQSIGSGLVEGACKQVISRRLKQYGARWRVRRANRMATLCGTLPSDTWTPYWEHHLNGTPESAHAPES